MNGIIQELSLPEAIQSRKRELQRKKEQLAELRKQQELRQQNSSHSVVSSYANDLDSLGFLSSSKKELDTFITSLLKSDNPVGTCQSTGIQVDLPPSNDHESSRLKISPQTLAMSDFVLTEVVPKSSVTYSKEVQTVETEMASMSIQEETEPLDSAVKQPSPVDEADPNVATKPIELDPDMVQKLTNEMSDDQKNTILESHEFLSFFDKSSKYMERALNEEYDVLVDYTTMAADTPDSENKNQIKHIKRFSNEKLTKERSITDIDWCKQFPELVLSSYTKDSVNYDSTTGQVLVWNMFMNERPEFALFADSEIMSCKFSPFHPNTIIGGSYSGQVFIWDTRAGKHPTLKTSVSSVGHIHPIYSMGFLGTSNAHHVLTASTDGVVCTWQTDMLSHPVEMLELSSNRHTRIDEVSVTCIGIPKNETSCFWVGTEEGLIYQASRFDRPGRKAGIDSKIAYTGHGGMITGLDFHPGGSRDRFSHYFLTSSIDWSVKLWKVENTEATSAMTTTTSGSATSTTDKACLFSFDDADDYIFDVKWCPTNPSVFACILGNGKLLIYNLSASNSQPEIPVVMEQVGNYALLKLAFDRDGKKLSVGARDGSLHVYDVSAVIAEGVGDNSGFSKFLKNR